MGGGLHVAAYYIEHHSELDAAATILTVAIPVAVAHRSASSRSTRT